MFHRIGRFVVRHPWATIVTWIVAAVVIVSLAPKLTSTTDESSFLPQHYESIQASNLKDQAFPSSLNVGAVVVFNRDGGAKLTAQDSAKVKQIASELQAKKIKGVTALVPGDVSPNRLVQSVAVGMQKSVMDDPNSSVGTDAVKTLRNDLTPLVKGTHLNVGVTGSEAQALDQQDASGNTEQIVLLATLGVILVLLLIIFRAPIIAITPLLLTILVALTANGLISFVSKWFGLKADSSIMSLLIVVLLGVGTDYFLFFMFRFRERLRLGEDKKTAVVNAVTRVGEAIATAGGVVIISFLALTLSSLGMLRQMGPSLAIAVAVTLLAALTLIPAVVSLVGEKMFWPSKSWQVEKPAARFGAIGRSMGRRPAVFAVLAAIVMLAFGAGALSYKSNFDLASSSMPASAESMVALKTLETGLPAGATDPTDVLLSSTNGKALTSAETSAFQGKLKTLDGVGSVAPPKLSKDGRTADYTVTLKYDPASANAMNAIKGPIRSGAHAAAPDGTKALVGGITSVYVDINAAVNHDYKLVFPVAAILIMIVLGLLLRSVVAPWYLMVSVGLGFAATLGASVLVFQKIGTQPGLMFLLPIIMYMFVVALGTDYNILMVARLREEAREGRSPRDAVREAVRHTAPTIAAAGVILACSFFTLLLGGNTFMSQIGFAVGFGIVIAAFVMAMFFTPSLTALIGHAAWWPGHQDRARRVVAGGRGADERELEPSKE